MSASASDRLAALFAVGEGGSIQSRVRRMIAELGGIDDADAHALAREMDHRLATICASVRDLCVDDDVTDAIGALPWIWLELRFEWMRYNLQMQYQTIFRGTADPLLMARGAALSDILAEVERCLDPESAFLVQKIAADHAGTARGAIERTDRLFTLMDVASAGSREAIETLMTAHDQILHLTESPVVRRELGKAVGAVIERMGSTLNLKLDDFTHALEGVLLRRVGSATLRVALCDESPDRDVVLPAAVATTLLEAADRWIDGLAASELTGSADERMASGRPAHVTLRTSLRRDGQRVEFAITDDAEGTISFDPDWSDRPFSQLRVRLRQRPSIGNEIVFVCDMADAMVYGDGVANVTEVMMLQVGLGATDAPVGVPLSMVRRIEQRDAAALVLQGTRLLDANGERTVPIIDLGERLFGTPIAPSGALYVHIGPDADSAHDVVLRVGGVNGICRGAVRPLPASLGHAPLRGFVQHEGRVVSVLDVDRLLGLVSNANRIERIAA